MTEEINISVTPTPNDVVKEPVNQSEKNIRVPKDPIFKDIVSLIFAGQTMNDFSINPGLQVGQTQLEIDVAVRAAETLSQSEIQARLKPTPFFFFAYLNVLEFKSASDKLDLSDFYRTAARALLAAAGYYESQNKAKGKKAGRPNKKKPQPARVVSCLICANYPQSVQDQLHTPFKPLEEQPKGFYFRPNSSELFLPAYLIVCSELPVKEEYYPLLVFASGNKLEEFIELMIDWKLEVYVKYVAKLHTEKVTEAFARRKRGGQLTTAEQKLVKTLVDILGEEQVIEILESKKLIKTLTKEELAQQLGVKGLIEMLRTLKPSLTAEELTELLLEAEKGNSDKTSPN